ncbi:MAG: hypothetical protein Q609_ECAC02035G0002, partial [Escherichia coli DORA_A_5_14_21]
FNGQIGLAAILKCHAVSGNKIDIVLN